MDSLDERVAFLEGRVEEQARHTDGIREAVNALERRVDRRLEAMDVRLETFAQSVDRRFEAIDARMDAFEQRVDRRFEAIDRRFENLERRFDALDDKFSRYFVWVLGAQVTTLAALVTAFATLLAR